MSDLKDVHLPSRRRRIEIKRDIHIDKNGIQIGRAKLFKKEINRDRAVGRTRKIELKGLQKYFKINHGHSNEEEKEREIYNHGMGRESK